MQACKVDEELLEEWVEKAKDEIWYLAPAISSSLAQKIIEADRRTGKKSCVIITVGDDMDRHGYGETGAVRLLKNNGKNIKHAKGILISVMVVKDGISAIWSPIAERVDSIDRVKLNGFCMETEDEREKIQIWLRGLMTKEQSSQTENFSNEGDNKETADTDSRSDGGGHIDVPKKAEVDVEDVGEGQIDEAEDNLDKHPVRDFKREKKVDVYSSYVGFIEIHLTGSSLSKSTTLSIPKELVELGLDENLRIMLSERMKIDLSKNVDLGVKEVNKLVDAFRVIFTRQMEEPLGRIYKKNDWNCMQAKRDEINDLVADANDKILQNLDTAADRVIKDAVNSWFEAIKARNASSDYTKEQVNELLTEQWRSKKRATRMKFKIFPKDLTWETLNDEAVRRKIEEAFPDIRKTGLYKDMEAWTED